MNAKDLYQAVGDIDEGFIMDAVVIKTDRAAGFKWAVPLAACLALAVMMAVPVLLRYQSGGGPASDGAAPMAGMGNMGNPDGGMAGNSGDTGAATPGEGQSPGPPSLKIEGPESEACYEALEDWRGLPADGFILSGEGATAERRVVYRSLQDLADYADAFVLIANVHEVAAETGDPYMQTAIAEYSETIGGRIATRQWDDYTVSTGSRVLIRQTLMGGCQADEPSNLLRVGGNYVLPLKFVADWGAYSVVGDLDALFELDDAGKMVSHARDEGLNQYDGMTLPEFMDVVRGLYPPTQ